MKNIAHDLEVTSVWISGREIRDCDLLSANFEEYLDRGFYEQTLDNLNSFTRVAFCDDVYKVARE